MPPRTVRYQILRFFFGLLGYVWDTKGTVAGFSEFSRASPIFYVVFFLFEAVSMIISLTGRCFFYLYNTLFVELELFNKLPIDNK
jgi:hypothetical protein